MNIEIRYANMADKDLLLSKDSHIKEDVWIDTIKNHREIIIFVDSRFAGWLRWNLFWDEIPFMNMLYLLDEYRSKGYGTQLVKFWENEMVKSGYNKVMTSSQANESAQHFYRSNNPSCSYANLFDDKTCPNVVSCESNNIYGCWQCDKADDYIDLKICIIVCPDTSGVYCDF